MIKLFHILGVILFLGNIIVTAVWRFSAEKLEDRAVKRFSIRLVQKTDWIFTLPGVLLIAITGHMLAPRFGGIGAHGWIYHSYALLTVSAIIWVGALLPIQRKQRKLMDTIESSDESSRQYAKLNRLWAILGGIATLLPLVALFLMVTHPS